MVRGLFVRIIRYLTISAGGKNFLPQPCKKVLTRSAICDTILSDRRRNHADAGTHGGDAVFYDVLNGKKVYQNSHEKNAFWGLQFGRIYDNIMVPEEGTETKEETKMMNLLINAYHTNSAANEYWFGFILNHLVYVVTGMTFEEIARFFKIEKAAASKGGFSKIRIKARVTECAELIGRATLLGGEEILQDEKWNVGIKFEKIVTEQIAGQKWERDSVPFWVAPDIALNGRNIQVKFNGAELTNERTIRKHFPEYLA